MTIKLFVFSIVIFFFTSCGIRNMVTFFPDTETEINNNNIQKYVSEIAINTIDDEVLQAFLFNHDNVTNKELVIYFHGNAGNVYHRFSYAKKLYNMNYNVLLVSYRGYSKSTGKPTEEGIYIDGKSAVKYAIDSLGYNINDIIIFGRSLGTTVAVEISQNVSYKGVILVTPLTSGKAMSKAMGLGLFKFIAGDSYNSIEKIENLKSKILIIHGDKDEMVPYKMGVELFEKYKGNKQMVTIPNGGHNNLQEIDSVLFWNSIEDFLNE